MSDRRDQLERIRSATDRLKAPADLKAAIADRIQQAAALPVTAAPAGATGAGLATKALLVATPARPVRTSPPRLRRPMRGHPPACRRRRFQVPP